MFKFRVILTNETLGGIIDRIHQKKHHGSIYNIGKGGKLLRLAGESIELDRVRSSISFIALV